MIISKKDDLFTLIARKLFLLSLTAYFLFLLVTFALLFNAWNIEHLNIEISHRLQSFHFSYLDIFFSYFTFLASGEATVLFSVIFSLYCYRYHRPVYLAIWLFMVGVVIELLIKQLVPVPPVNLEDRDIFRLGMMVATHYSFPSGHAMRSVFFGIFLTYFAVAYLHWNRYATTIIAGMAMLLLLYSRSYLGVHWFVDVLGGALLGLGLALTAVLIMKRIPVNQVKGSS